MAGVFWYYVTPPESKRADVSSDLVFLQIPGVGEISLNTEMQTNGSDSGGIKQY